MEPPYLGEEPRNLLLGSPQHALAKIMSKTNGLTGKARSFSQKHSKTGMVLSKSGHGLEIFCMLSTRDY